jgi:hypothetical protein
MHVSLFGCIATKEMYPLKETMTELIGSLSMYMNDGCWYIYAIIDVREHHIQTHVAGHLPPGH